MAWQIFSFHGKREIEFHAWMKRKKELLQILFLSVSCKELQLCALQKLEDDDEKVVRVAIFSTNDKVNIRECKIVDALGDNVTLK